MGSCVLMFLIDDLHWRTSEACRGIIPWLLLLQSKKQRWIASPQWCLVLPQQMWTPALCWGWMEAQMTCSAAAVGFQPWRRAALLEFTTGDYLLSLFQYLNTISHPEGNRLSHETEQNNNESWNLSEMANNDDSIHITFPGVNSATIKSLPSVGWLLSEKAAFTEPFSLFCILWAASLSSCCNPQAVSQSVSFQMPQ